MSSENIINRLLKIKKELKEWETNFLEKEKRKPAKNDINLAPKNIRDKYKLYSKLKIEDSRSPWLQESSNNLSSSRKISSTDDAMKTKSLNSLRNLSQKIKNNSLNFKPRVSEAKIDNLETVFQSKIKFKQSNKNEKLKKDIDDVVLNSQTDVVDISIKPVLSCSFKEKLSVILSKSPIKDNEYNSVNIQSTNEVINQQNIDSEIPSMKRKYKSIETNLNEIELPIKKMRTTKSKQKVTDSVKMKQENYVKLNMKVKKYKKKGSTITGCKYKRQVWKKRNKSGKCFKCGLEGHWANKCSMGKNIWDGGSSTVKKLENEIIEMNKNSEIELVDNNMFPSFSDLVKYKETCLERTDYFSEAENMTLRNSSNGFKADKEVMKFLKKFGHTDWRFGQEEAVMRILCGVSTLICLPTGAGKSLCYQLPALMYSTNSSEKHCIALIISPLVSLMDDQVSRMKCVKGACLHTGLTVVQRDKVFNNMENIHLLLLSPEMLVKSVVLPNQLPQISFACIDEAHCLDDWSHHFRPTYLKVCAVLRNKFRVNCLVGLTATALPSTIDSICNQLRITNKNNVVSNMAIPENLLLSISKDSDKDKALLNLLNGERFKNSTSIIIYCNRRQDTDRVATVIRTVLSWTAESYHAGLNHSQRRKMQIRFMKGTLRVIVATLAFGMGLDKSNVRSVIHYNMPKSIESYVQEIGRAGRDGLPADCHVFLDSNNEELNEHRRHIYAVTVDRSSIKKLVKKIFKECECSVNNCVGHECLFDIDDTIMEMDIKEEVLSTLMCYMELDGYIDYKQPSFAKCTLKCYGGPKQLLSSTLKSPPVGLAALNLKQDLSSASQIIVNIESISKQLNWSCWRIIDNIRNLEWENRKKTGVILRFDKLSFCVAYKRLNDIDIIIDNLYERVLKQQRLGLRKLKSFHQCLLNNSYNSSWNCCDTVNEEISKQLKNTIDSYFNKIDINNDNDDEIIYDLKEDDGLEKLIIEFIQLYRSEHDLNGRCIARIFHGIDSPRFPATVWGRTRFWRCRLSTNFDLIRIKSIELFIKN